MAVGAELVHFLAPDTAMAGTRHGCRSGCHCAVRPVSVPQRLVRCFRGQLNINALMSVAVAGAFAIGQWPEAAMVMALYSLAELIEARSVERARNAITGLLQLSPPQVEVRQVDGSWATVEAKAVAVGAVARVKPGERFALDGRVTEGQSAVDQSPVTGESIPVDRRRATTYSPGRSARAGRWSSR